MSTFDRNLLNNNDRRTNFGEITLALASPERVRAWSYGEVRLPETINYRTLKPEPGGLFCAKIFGPIKDYECLCGKYKRVKHRNIICEKCGVEVTVERVRRERMGHISLACPVAHILFFKSVPSRIGLMMDLTMRDIERVLYFEAYVVLDPKRLESESVGSLLHGEGSKEARSYSFDRGTLLSTEQHAKVAAEFGASSFVAGVGAEGLRSFLKAIDLEEEVGMLRDELDSTTSSSKKTKLYKRLKLMENFRLAKLRPEWMILEALPVLPPGLRPLVQLDGGRFTTSDLNDLYRRVINRNNRLRKLIELDAPDIIVNNEKRMLQESVDSLLDNGRRGKPAVGANKRPLKSLADVVKGKSGRFRQNLLGKRVDFSARSVIVVGPSLKLHQCGLPKHMALNLFRPFVFNQLVARNHVGNIKQARFKVDNPDGEVWDILEQVIHQHPIMLNRAPTLHRLGIQAFEPVLIEGKAIQLHPLVCVAFNADFDGDQMAVHVPLSLEAQAEARTLMLSSNNILAPANGEPIILPTQDIVLGIYYATRERQKAAGEGMRFGDLAELETALAVGAVHLQAKIRFPLPPHRLSEKLARPGEDAPEEPPVLVETTVGRALMLSFYPEKMPFPLINRTLKKKDLTHLVNRIFHACGLRETVVFCDRLMRFGFAQSTRAGISICMDDMVIPAKKAGIVRRAEKEMQEARQQFRGGLLTEDERYNKSVDLWDKAGEEISREMMRELSFEPVRDPYTGEAVVEQGEAKMQDSFNSLYMMADSGARGSQTQIKQLAGMRGLMTKPDGRIMETAITANFREGLTGLQYFLSTHGARKGLSDTALKTANSGYLTRRLVDVAQDMVVVTDDCGAAEGIVIRAVLMGGEVVVPLADRILGRVLAKDIPHPQTAQVLYAAGTLVNEEEAAALADAGVDEVTVRTPVKCKLPHGLCAKCYGRDLARGRAVQIGEAVGVIAAQSIGEPGTQLTMRTFHIGGAASRAVMARSVEAKSDGRLRIQARTVANSRGDLVVVSRGGEMSVHDKDGRERERYRLQYGEVLRVKEGGEVKAGQQVSHRDPLIRPIITEHGGTVRITGLEDGVNARRQVDEITGVESWVVTEDKRAGKKLLPVLMRFMDDKGRPVCIHGTETEVSITLRPDTTILVREGSAVSVGDVVATMPQETGKSRDITGGLPRVAELFEAREPKEPSLLSPADGHINMLDIVRGKQQMTVEEDNAIMAPASGVIKFLPEPKRTSKKKAAADDAEEAAAAESEQGAAAQKQLRQGGSIPVTDVVITDADGKEHKIPVPKGRRLAVTRMTEVDKIVDGKKKKVSEKTKVKKGDKLIFGREHEIIVPKGRNVLVQDGMFIKKGEEIVEGDANPHEILAMRGVEALATHIVDEVQAVYRLQGVSINDKHIEVIVRQMLRCVVIDDPGDSRYMRGDQLVLSQVLEENERLAKAEQKPAGYHYILLGITKASLATDSFISAASFQETTRVLTESAVSGRRDQLRGLKENVIVGRLIPAGTGFVHYRTETREEQEAEEILRAGLSQGADVPGAPAPDSLSTA